MKKTIYLIMPVVVFCVLHTGKIYAQTTPAAAKHKIAVFAPLYIDSAFDADTEYRYAKTIFPKFFNPGLEFYEGVQLAMDSLNKENAQLEVFVYDTRSANSTIAQQLSQSETDGVELMLVHCTGPELKAFADAGLKRNVPVINVNLPVDGGITANPFFVMLNSTLRTQCETTLRHLQKNYPLHQVVVFRRKGAVEDRIKSYLDDAGKSPGPSMKLKYVELTDSFTVNQLKAQLDTTVSTICLSGSLDEQFGRRLIKQLASIKKPYKIMAAGLSTWDNLRSDLKKTEYKGIEILYCTPFYNAKTDKLSINLSEYFNRVMFARPSDMVFRGYETAMKYTRLLMQYGHDLASNLSSRQFKMFTDYDVQPVLNRQTMMLDYFENKKLYFLKWQDGVIKQVY